MLLAIAGYFLVEDPSELISEIRFAQAEELVLDISSAQPLAESAPENCVKVASIPRYGALAYDHWVSVENTCGGSRDCELSTDVNPEIVGFSLADGEKRDFLTYKGSPARVFATQLTCRKP